MKSRQQGNELIVGLDVPALIIDLDAFEYNVVTLRHQIELTGVRLRAHCKTHKSVDIARFQIEHGGACSICCQKLSEAEVMVEGGISDVLISNQVVDPVRLDPIRPSGRKSTPIDLCRRQ